jgi:AGCS family alanine or glycine:cation symporter
MCGLYLLAGLFVVLREIHLIPAMLKLIVIEAFQPSEAVGAFLGGTAGFGFLKGMQRALFSNEAGQGSAPIAHSAAKTDEPVREGVVAGLEPFIDTLCVCTLTALVILLSGQWNRSPDLDFKSPAAIVAAEGGFTVGSTEVTGDALAGMQDGQAVFAIVEGETNSYTGANHHKINGT